jgi:cation diffusion facilitator family transporter
VASRDLTRYGWLSIGTALATMGLKFGAWTLTGSVGLLSDALESTVNLAAAVLMLVALRIGSLPPDDNHQFGHEKAELFSAAAEGLMIVAAASLIIGTAVERLLHPAELDRVGIGLAVSAVAAGLNLGVGWLLLRAGRAHRSGALVADGRHLLTDVRTSAGVLAAVLLVGATGWDVLDPLIALAVGGSIVVTGSRLLWSSVTGLMDPPLPADELARLEAVMARYREAGIAFHAVRSRVAGSRRFMSVHVLVPGHWTVRAGHDLLERFEADLRAVLPGIHAFTHLEPIEDPASYADQRLDRTDAVDPAPTATAGGTTETDAGR